MIAQLSQSVLRGRPSSSISGVSREGFFSRNSGESVFPQASISSTSSPAARVKMRTVRLLTLGLSTWSLIAVIGILRRCRVSTGSSGERSSESDGRERATIISMASARWISAML